MGWYSRYGFDAIEVSENEVLTVNVAMDWRLNAAKDFSLVAWSTVSPVEIIADGDANLASASWPLTTMLSDDLNNVSESGADLCSDNPEIIAFNNYVAGISCAAGSSFGW